MCVFFKNKLHLFIWTQHGFILFQIVLLFVYYIFWPVLKPSSDMSIRACYCIPKVSHLILFVLHLFDSFCITCNLAFLLWCVSFAKCCIMTMNIKCNVNILFTWMYVWVWGLCNICLCRLTEMRSRLWTHQLQELMHRHW